MHKYINLYVIIFVCISVKGPNNSSASQERASIEPLDFAEDASSKELGIKRKIGDSSWKIYRDIPLEFDARNKISHLCQKGQVSYGASKESWAYTAHAVFFDRLCIGSGNQFQGSLSVQQLKECCTKCTGVLNSGDRGSLIATAKALEYYQDIGGVGEENYTTYGICPDKYRSEDTRFRWRFKRIYSLDGEDDIKRDIYTFGPVAVHIMVYKDFEQLETGTIYHNHNRSDEEAKLLAAKIIGWGSQQNDDDDQTTVHYWLCINTSNEYKWGNNGEFKLGMNTDTKHFMGIVIAGEIMDSVNTSTETSFIQEKIDSKPNLNEDESTIDANVEEMIQSFN